MDAITLPAVNPMYVTLVTIVVAFLLRIIPDQLQSRWKSAIAFVISCLVTIPTELIAKVTDFNSIALMCFAVWVAAMGTQSGIKSAVLNK